MRFLKFIEKESSESYQQLALMAVISGISNGLLLAIVNHAAQAVALDEDLTQYFILYMVTFALFLYTQWFAYEKAITLIEEAIYNIRTRLSKKVREVELSFIESIGVNNLYSRLTQNDTFVSQAIPQLTAAAQMSILMIFSFLYLAYISPITFVITIGTIAIGVFIFISQSKIIKKSLQNVRQREAKYFKSISDMVNGFQEIKINEAKGQDILNNISEVSEVAKGIKIAAGKKEAKMWGFGRIFIYAILPILIFIVPNFIDEHASDIFKITATLLFITGPITILVNMLPIVNRLNMALEEMSDLEAEMDAATTDSVKSEIEGRTSFTEIKMDQISFSYPGDNAGFSAGPFNQSIQAGELLFVVGGNGSGKSTFLKLLTGLYQPANGSLYIDNTQLQKHDFQSYRNLFSVVFTDFHLFQKLYGIKQIDPEMVNHWLKKMRMEHKVQYKDRGFTSTSLSTGQRKRLAFIAAILEDKPIIVLDEFAADQDPQFRQYFYEELLIELKSLGKTIIAVTHDDHYFHVADRVLKMDSGKLLDYTDPKSLPQ